MRLAIIHSMRHSGTEEAPDRALLDAVADGEVAAFEQLYRRYFRKVYGFSMRMLSSPDLAEEVAADTLMTVWRRAADFEGRSKPSTWIFGIAYRLGMAAVRRREKETRADQAAEDLADLTPNTDDIDSLFLRRDLSRALQGLSATHRATLELAYTYGYGVNEIARIMDCPPGTVKTRMMHARGRLRNLMSGGGHGEEETGA